MKYRMIIVFGTRPEFIKLAPLIKLIKSSEFSSKVAIVNTNQHNELLEQQLSYWNIKPDYSINIRKDKSLIRMLSSTLVEFQNLIDLFQSLEYIVVQGDTNTALAASQVSFFNKIKLIHIEAGLRSGNLFNPFPEEFNRTLASRVAYFHFAPTETSKENLINEGIDSSIISVTGNTVIDAMNYVREKDQEDVKEKDWLIITIHRRENIENNYKQLIGSLSRIMLKHPDIKIVWVQHPNSSDKIGNFLADFPNISFLKYKPYNEFIKLYNRAALIITDSGGVTEESSQMGIPTIVYRDNTERTEPMESDFPMIVSMEEETMAEFIHANISKRVKPGCFYGDGDASSKIFEWIRRELYPIEFETVIMGGGPAGTGIIMNSLKEGKFNELLNNGIAIIEQSDDLVSGNLPEYEVNSDTSSKVFLECLDGETLKYLDRNDLEDEIQKIDSFQGESIPLGFTKEYLRKIGKQINKLFLKSEKSQVFLKTQAQKVIVMDNGFFEIQTVPHKKIIAKNVIVASGGKPFSPKLEENQSNRSIHSDILIRGEANAFVTQKLQEQENVIILGGSHSGFSSAYYLLKNYKQYLTKENSITIWCHELPKVFFSSETEAILAGYSDFTSKDICPKTGRVYRLAGLRMDGRELYLNMLGMGKGTLEKRVCIKQIDEDLNSFNHDMKSNSLIIKATGYELNIPFFMDENENRIAFAGELTKHWVNDKSQLLMENGIPLNNAYALGLATGYIPQGELGGEESFTGQTNGLWYYQNLLAKLINEQLEHADSSIVS